LTGQCGDIFSLQDAIVQTIVVTLRLQIALLNRGIWTKRTTDNPEAYDYFLRGVGYYSAYSKEGNLKARHMLENAIELDPKYADAYALLGLTYWLADFYAWTKDPQVLEHAFELAKQAISLDDSAPGGHNLMSCVQASKRNYDLAVAEAKRAIALDPNYAESYLALGHALMFSGRPEEAIGAEEKALRLDPRSQDFYFGELGTAYVFMGRYKEAIPLLKQNLVSFPDELGVHFDLAIAYSELGRMDEARAEVLEINQLSPQLSAAAIESPSFSLKDRALRVRFAADLRRAGLK
jgi:adenylate cyclase